MLIPQYMFEYRFVTILLLLCSRDFLLYMPMLGEIPLQLCFVDCCVSFILTTQALGLPTPSISSLLVEESFSLRKKSVFFWFKENWVV